MSNQIEDLVKKVIEIEKQRKLKYPNLLGGRAIDELYGKPLTLDEWLEFHKLYRQLNPEQEQLRLIFRQEKEVS